MENQKKLSEPVFLASSVRSGSTLLHLILDSHPSISNPGEVDFLFDRISDDGAISSIDEYNDFLSTDRIFQSKKLRIAPTSTTKQLILDFVLQLRKQEDVLTLNIHRNFKRTQVIFPNARYIHLVRDPRDVANSCIGMGWAGHVYYGVDIWEKAEISWDELREMLRPEQYLEVKFESFIMDIEKELERICNFLGICYSKKMLNYSNTSTYSAPDKSLCFQWKKKYSKREVQLVETKVSKLLISRGYQKSEYRPITPNLIERVQIFTLNKRRKFSHRIASFGFALFVKEKIARIFGIRKWQRDCQKKINILIQAKLK